MDFSKRWHNLYHIGQGGQGTVSCVRDNKKFNIDGTNGLFETIVQFTQEFRHDTNIVDKKKLRKRRIEPFRKAVAEVIQMEDSANHGALKILHEPLDKKDAKKAEDRIKKEIEAMVNITHPNLLKILHHDPDAKWFVSEFHPKGTLAENKDLFTGNFVRSLRAFRPLVEGVSKLHKDGWVHRDIKPQNVFVDSNNNLVLGDFGLVFFTDEQHRRISEAFENVGSRDWMPAWAMGMRIEDIKPTFDVFCLGKLLWAMVSSTPILRLWYFDQPQFNLEEMFPNAPSIKLANMLFKKCIVEFEENCLSDATALLEEVDKVLSMIDRNADFIGENIPRPCKVCGIGKYELYIDRNREATRSFGVDPTGTRLFKIFICNYCRNVQMFLFPDEKSYPPWR